MGAADKLNDLNLTSDEVSKFEKAFSDPKFRELFMDYAREISDPAAKAENDAYLRQIENNGQSSQVYGKNVQLILPEKGFAVKTKNLATQAKVFVNICHSAKVDKATSTAKGNGQAWLIPHTLAGERAETDKGGAACAAHDFCVHPDTLARAKADMRFNKLLVETALEAVEKARSVRLDPNYTLPKLAYKGPEKPPVMAIKGDKSSPGLSKAKGSEEKEEGGAGAGEKDGAGPKGAENAEASTKKVDNREFIRPVGTPEVAGVLPAQTLPARPESAGGGAGAGAPRSGFSFAGKPRAAPAAESAPNALGEVAPRYEIIHRGARDLGEAWNDGVGPGAVDRVRRPDALVVRVTLPKLESVAGVDLDVAATRITLHKPGIYLLDLPLPFDVDDAKGTAKFDKSARALIVTLPVRPAPAADAGAGAPRMAGRPPAAPAGALVTELSSTEAPPEEEEEAGAEADAETGAEAASGALVPASAAAPAAPAESANERAWRLACEHQKALEAAEDAEVAAAAAAASAAAAAGGPARPAALPVATSPGASMPGPTAEFLASPAYAGPRRGYVFKMGPQGLGYYLDTRYYNPAAAAELLASDAPAPAAAAAAPGAAAHRAGAAKPAAPAPPVLKPRLMAAAAMDELD